VPRLRGVERVELLMGTAPIRRPTAPWGTAVTTGLSVDTVAGIGTDLFTEMRVGEPDHASGGNAARLSI